MILLYNTYNVDREVRYPSLEGTGLDDFEVDGLRLPKAELFDNCCDFDELAYDTNKVIITTTVTTICHKNNKNYPFRNASQNFASYAASKA